MSISKREVQRLLTDEQDCFLDEAREVLRAGLETVKGSNFFDPVGNALLHALQDPRVNIAGIHRAAADWRCLIRSPHLGSHASFAACVTSD